MVSSHQAQCSLFFPVFFLSKLYCTYTHSRQNLSSSICFIVACCAVGVVHGVLCAVYNNNAVHNEMRSFTNNGTHVHSTLCILYIILCASLIAHLYLIFRETYYAYTDTYVYKKYNNLVYIVSYSKECMQLYAVTDLPLY